MGLSPFVISAGINALGSLFGRRDEEAQARENAERANEMARENATIAWQRNVKASDRANRWSERQATVAEGRSDRNAQISRQFNAQQAQRANRFTDRQNDVAFERSEARDLRNRDWAKEDYQQQKDDFASQFTRLREAAVAGGFNPLSVLGSQMTPSMGAGGLSSSAYGAGVGVGASSGFSAASAPTPSVPMAYAADVSVQPLVSNAGLVGGLAEFGREITGANAVQRKTDQLYLDLAQIQLDQARSGFTGALGAGGYPQLPAGSVPGLGPQAVPAGPTSSSNTPQRLGGAATVGEGRRIAGFDLDAGQAPVFNGGTPADGGLGVETRPMPISTGMSYVMPEWLPRGNSGLPYQVFGDADEAFQLENLPQNLGIIAGQMYGRWRQGDYVDLPTSTMDFIRHDPFMGQPYGTLPRVAGSVTYHAPPAGGLYDRSDMPDRNSRPW